MKSDLVVFEKIENILGKAMKCAGNRDIEGVFACLKHIRQSGGGVKLEMAASDFALRHCLDCIDEYKKLKNKSKVYFVKSLSTGFLKIGYTNMPVGERLSQFKNMCAGGISLIKVVKVSDKRVETMLHQKFKKLKVNGEWFRPEKELTEYIDSIENGSLLEI